MGVPNRIAERLVSALKRFQPILSSAKSRDVNESDTSMIVTDIMAEMFGYDKYSEITRELCIRGTYCDLATRIENKIQMIIEVKAVGLELKDAHVKQAVDYAANGAIEWVALTNGQIWKVYKVTFSKPIDATLVLDLDLLAMSHRSDTDIASLYLLTRESMVKSGLYAYHDQKEATNKFYLAALLLSDPVLDTVKRELRKLSGARIQNDELQSLLMQDVLKRDLFDGEKAEAARRKVARALVRSSKPRKEELSPIIDSLNPELHSDPKPPSEQ
ncbi:MAG TPA: type I restriction enzyme HsdR N-terminal domain-containing protein [Acidobacteriota bacterium]|nr:type I restriction enzyme HsdR N-terminal domain-containing protein [Acidobacteriota bacterium]HQM64814.1 type I restriction enzyme HsdR N-terminal domain-containing protein [Acidobacteriota bacterium]